MYTNPHPRVHPPCTRWIRRALRSHDLTWCPFSGWAEWAEWAEWLCQLFNRQPYAFKKTTTFIWQPTMPSFNHIVPDVCWLEVITHSCSGKVHSEVICIHCQKIWFSNARIHIVQHLKDCKELPQHLWERYQSSWLQFLKETVNALKKCKQSSSWMNRMKNSETELLNELLAEFFYDAGIALSLMSDSYNEITYYISYWYI